ncbi:MAG: helix-turn-helix domain-containing protein [Ruminococcus sp.]|nr:helix-turn-helix domain-containing protein [Ruminococcus sp.]
MFEEKIAALNSAENIPSAGKRTYTVNEIQDILGVGKNAAYAAVKSGEFQVVKIGGSIRISKKSFDAWLDGLQGSD